MTEFAAKQTSSGGLLVHTAHLPTSPWPSALGHTSIQRGPSEYCSYLLYTLCDMECFKECSMININYIAVVGCKASWGVKRATKT
jgi:hypothetical protein